jgi:hypothetical protein
LVSAVEVRKEVGKWGEGKEGYVVWCPQFKLGGRSGNGERAKRGRLFGVLSLS